MPLYEYKCNDCDNTFEVLQKMSAEPLNECLSCNGKSVEKLISNSSFQLKGSGWYVTDYKNSNKRPNQDTNTGNTGNKNATIK